MADIGIRVKLIFVNKGCINALAYLADMYDDLAEDFPYREDVQKGLRATRYLARHAEIEYEAQGRMFDERNEERDD